jgi:ABC-type glycerol-3-phosphate transport system permease component
MSSGLIIGLVVLGCILLIVGCILLANGQTGAGTGVIIVAIIGLPLTYFIYNKFFGTEPKDYRDAYLSPSTDSSDYKKI